MWTALKRMLGVELLDDEDQANLAHDIRKYTEIVKSSKYADSNSNTEALENLLKAMTLDDATKNSAAAAEEAALPAKERAGLAVVVKKGEQPQQQQQQIDAKQNGEQKSEPASQLYEPGQIGNRFVDHLTSHLKLLDELEGENATLLPGQPVFQPAKFGKTGGNKFVLRRFTVPSWIYDAIQRNNVSQLDLKSPMTSKNYVLRFQCLLWLEEAHQSVEMRRYDQNDVMLARYERDFFCMTVPGLAEGRPSLMRGDRLVLKSSHRATYYEGFIYEVRENDIVLKLHESLHSNALDGLKFEVSFLSSRTPFRRCHHGVLQYEENAIIKHIVFPQPAHEQISEVQPMVNVRETDGEQLRCFQTYLNTYQRKAVINVLRAQGRPAPYIIFGPPGTGKTITMVESILQVYARKPNSRILVCGNSNSCADLLATRIQNSDVVPKDLMVRVSAFYRMEKLIPPELEGITKDMEMISASMYANYRMVITTCIQSGALYEFRERFDYVFIDEAGHANEPEALISLGLLKRDGCAVLAGDHHQLGPVSISHVAGDHGLATSLLERLTRRAVYQRRVQNSKMAYDGRYITKLIICYRSDPRVLAVNNNLFYHNELKFTVETPKMWMDFLNISHPLVFHCVKGRDRREYLNPSWFNANEAIVCLSYVKRLYDAGLKPEQLGIITPYRRQIEKLGLLFGSCNLKTCKIATMEEFQGDEREVIIISTVRTRSKNIEFDKRFKLGFLFNPKRFNVAISRAKWLVIVVGEPEILSRDPHWQEYIREAHKIGMDTE